MRITFWGTRGSIAKPGPATARYGGNTSCVEVRSDSGALIVVDCGTGGHALGQRLMAERKESRHGHILISHTHWDHIQGIPFFAPLFGPGDTWDIYGPKGLSHGVRATLAGQMEHTYFPIALDQFAATIRYHDLVEGSFMIDDIKVTTHYLNHPALTLAYRFEADGATAIYCCDHEPHGAALATGEGSMSGGDKRHADFLAGADLVMHDAQYTASEYPVKVGWGHSTIEYAVRVCREAAVKTLALTHHDPLRTDDAVDIIIEQTRERLRRDGASLKVIAAAEGVTLELTGNKDRSPERPSGQPAAQTAIGVSPSEQPVLVYVSDPKTLDILSEAIALEGFPLKVFASQEDLRRCVVEERPSLVMVEHCPPLIDGDALTLALRHTMGTVAADVPLITIDNDPAPEGSGFATNRVFGPLSLGYARAKIRSSVLRQTFRWVRPHFPDPKREHQRLLALRGLALLETAPEERFDRLTRVASAALSVPMARLSFMDDHREWVKSGHGVGGRGTPREAAFCAHLVEMKKELIVPSTLQDERFADNPQVLGEPHIRFYAGAPLILKDGHCVGALSVLDIRPRELSPADLAILRDVRDLVLDQIQRPT